MLWVRGCFNLGVTVENALIPRELSFEAGSKTSWNRGLKGSDRTRLPVTRA